MKKMMFFLGMTVMMMVGVSIGSVCSAQSESYNALGLDDRTYFDIYIGGYDDAGSVIRNVKISGLKEIAGETFLIIQTQFLDAKRYEGLIAFHQVRAILPTNSAVVESKGLKQNSPY